MTEEIEELCCADMLTFYTHAMSLLDEDTRSERAREAFLRRDINLTREAHNQAQAFSMSLRGQVVEICVEAGSFGLCMSIAAIVSSILAKLPDSTLLFFVSDHVC